MARSLLAILITLICLGITESQQIPDRPSPPNGKDAKRQSAGPSENGGAANVDHAVVAPIATPTAGNDRENRDDGPKTDWWLVGFTAALVIVGYFQYRALRHHEQWMRKNVEVVKEIAEAATSSAKTAKDTLTITDERLRTSNEAAIANAKAAQLNAQAVINSERPWIVVSIEQSQPHRFAFKAVNYGRTPAEIVSANTQWTTVVDEMRDLPSPVPNYGKNVLAYPNLLPPMQTLQFYLEDIEQRLTVAPAAEIAQGRLRLLYYGCVRYHDMLDTSSVHETRFCYWYNPASSGLLLGGPEQYNQRT